MKTCIWTVMALLAGAILQPALARKHDPHRPYLSTVHAGRTQGSVRNGLPHGGTDAQIYRDGQLLSTKNGH